MGDVIDKFYNIANLAGAFVLTLERSTMHLK